MLLHRLRLYGSPHFSFRYIMIFFKCLRIIYAHITRKTQILQHIKKLYDLPFSDPPLRLKFTALSTETTVERMTKEKNGRKSDICVSIQANFVVTIDNISIFAFLTDCGK